ncbi:alpha/beta fold hydrolase [Actibacterium sp. 188UL27-1]|uniref:alpha/beta hydrolase family protein n=1 Tax=Actibacterium sp. 188UL27-1 TaxID=2786961 RepID=UPI00195AC1C8|nr:alpha/beta fold hydrolase [Actibacterium sp. 188UL27-1]MBM7069674.1 alpha/beta fold hydrolase [Actibacterium sp. 188UL27-1]
MTCRPLTLAALIGLAQIVSPAEAQDIPGYDRFDISAAHRSMPLAASVWYPAGRATYRNVIGDSAIFEGSPAYIGAAIAPGPYPVIVLSHGSGGNMDAISWLSSRLALEGAIVLAVNHPGSTSGDSSPRRSVQLTQRAADLSAALDTLLNDPHFGPFIDPGRIASVGFSLGGSTVLKLGGAAFERDSYKTYCETQPETDAGCLFLAKGGVDLGKLPDTWEQSIRDPRITATIAIDPGWTHAVTAASAGAMDQPTLFLNLGAPEPWQAADVTPNGSDLMNKMPDVTYHAISPANHFTFLAVCKPNGAAFLEEQEDDPICTDPQNTDRNAVHDEIIAQISAFLKL